METETIKFGLIDRLMRIQNLIAIGEIKELMIQSELEARAEESLDAIRKGDVLSIEEFAEQKKLQF